MILFFAVCSLFIYLFLHLSLLFITLAWTHETPQPPQKAIFILSRFNMPIKLIVYMFTARRQREPFNVAEVLLGAFLFYYSGAVVNSWQGARGHVFNCSSLSEKKLIKDCEVSKWVIIQLKDYKEPAFYTYIRKRWSYNNNNNNHWAGAAVSAPTYQYVSAPLLLLFPISAAYRDWLVWH